MSLKYRIAGLIIGSSMAFPAMALNGTFYVGPTLNFTSYAKNGARFQGLSPLLALGYGDLLIDCLYLSGEIFAGTTIKWSNHRKNGTDLTTTTQFGASLLPGYILDNVVMAYLRFGVIATNFDNLNTTKHGYVFGGGLEYLFNANWSVRGEYDAIKYAAINGVGHVSAGTYSLGLKYTFL